MMGDAPGTLRSAALPVVLGSQSPQRQALLSLLMSGRPLEVLPPRLPAEPDFVGLTTLAAVEARLMHIARMKCTDVRSQLDLQGRAGCVVTADTVIIGFDASGGLEVCGKPPDDPAARAATVRRWFRELYAGRPHLAKTGLCVAAGANLHERIVTTEVWFRCDCERFLDWYLQTGEPTGKAGGYAIQGAGSLFVERISGSLSNVVGLPLVETADLLVQAAADPTS